MPRYEWTERFIDDRVCTVVAETMKEAKKKREDGFWASEQTLDFYSTGEASDLVQVDHPRGE